MPSYLIQVAYTPDAWAAMVKRRRTGSRRSVRLSRSWAGSSSMRGWPSGSNTVGVVDLPENTDAAAFSMAVAAAGAVKAFKTTPLLSVEEGVEALRKAQAAGYRRPGG